MTQVPFTIDVLQLPDRGAKLSGLEMVTTTERDAPIVPTASNPCTATTTELESAQMADVTMMAETVVGTERGTLNTALADTPATLMFTMPEAPAEAIGTSDKL